ncbi:restriction endonuclease subunit S [Providencia alcalifaciens]|uniref:restriction endonuclease subunit S n=1 Tax=Providencia alcalifaciens TaxID=126385 RepID=UPI0032D9B865
MSIKKNVPEIRFKKFILDWQNKEIGNILAEIKRPVKLLDSEIYQLVTVKRRNEGIVPRSMLKGKNILVKNYYGIKAGDYLISKRQVVHGANGVVPEGLDNAVVSNEYLVVTDSDEITAKFWSVISKRPEMYKLFFISSYGVDIEKLVFDISDWKKRAITVPDVAEQNAITDYFQKLDVLINQHQQKHNKLSNLKKAMLEKMFPKQGETIPEIRFKGFSGEWEEKELSELTDYANGKGHEDKQKTSGKYELINLNSISVGGGLKPSGKFIDETNNTLEKNDLVMVLSDVGHGDLLGRTALIPKSNAYVLNQRVALLRPYRNVCPLFLLYNINAHQTYFKKQGAGMSQLNISRGSVESFYSCIPEQEEQTAIGNYFQKLDILINQHQQQITKLNNIKQACLSKMFV